MPNGSRSNPPFARAFGLKSGHRPSSIRHSLASYTSPSAPAKGSEFRPWIKARSGERSRMSLLLHACESRKLLLVTWPDFFRGAPHALHAGFPSHFPHRALSRVWRKLRNGYRKVLVACIAALLLYLASFGRSLIAVTVIQSGFLHIRVLSRLHLAKLIAAPRDHKMARLTRALSIAKCASVTLCSPHIDSPTCAVGP